jgi:hypothetical protein
MRGFPAVLIVVGLGTSVHAQALQGDTPSAVSVEHITAGLQRPPLYIPPPSVPAATFHVEVDERWPPETPLDVVRRELAADVGASGRPGPLTGGTPALAQVDVLPAIYGAVHRFQAIRREHAEAAARREVAEDFAQFCAEHDCSATAADQAIEGVILP